MSKKEKSGRPVARKQLKLTEYTVKEPMELMDFLMKVREGISRNSAKSLLANRLVHVDNIITTQYNYPLVPGMRVYISKEKSKKEFHHPQLKIVYEDAYLIVADKRQGLPAAPTGTGRGKTAYSILDEYVKRSARQHKVYTVNRLDKDASGLLLFAKDEKTKVKLQDYWDEIIKQYRFVAVLSGEMEKVNGAISSWIMDGKMYVTYTSMTNKNIDKAVTLYKLIKKANGYSLVELETEKKNLIRAHLHELKYPILGDIKYGDGNDPIDRLALHAFKLSLYHPVTGELMEFETPYPAAFKKLMLKETSSPRNNQ